MNKDAWIELPAYRSTRIWDRFDEAFQFRPSVRPEDWPTFLEPAPSLTWDIREQLDAFYPWHDPQATPYNLALLQALRACVAEDEPVLALDWQHTGYDFYPHRFRGADNPKSWCIPALPAAEYHIFVTADHRLGSLGHPWAQTLCIFGEGFVDAYRAASPLDSSKLIRQQAALSARRQASAKRARGTQRPFHRRK